MVGKTSKIKAPNVIIKQDYGNDPVYRQIQTDLSLALQEYEQARQHLDWVKSDCKERMKKYHEAQK